MLEQKRARQFAIVAVVYADDVARHDVPAPDVWCRPFDRLQLDLPQQPLEIVTTDVEGLLQCLESSVDVCTGKTDTPVRRWVDCLMRI
ncbi:hypothetical protein D9M69_648480 [compost metagenome]